MQKIGDKSLALKLKMLRLESGKSQEVLSAELGISRSTLANYETGKRQPDGETLSKIALLFDVGDEFFTLPLRRPLASLREGADSKMSLPQNAKGTKPLDISALPPYYRLCMLELYDFYLNQYTAPHPAQKLPR